MTETLNISVAHEERHLNRMAKEGTRVELNLTLIQGLKKYPKACFWSIALSTTIIMEGIAHAVFRC
jgi:SP family general alpha glucoside:H+ symporter-like MFS transporter